MNWIVFLRGSRRIFASCVQCFYSRQVVSNANESNRCFLRKSIRVLFKRCARRNDDTKMFEIQWNNINLRNLSGSRFIVHLEKIISVDCANYALRAIGICIQLHLFIWNTDAVEIGTNWLCIVLLLFDCRRIERISVRYRWDLLWKQLKRSCTSIHNAIQLKIVCKRLLVAFDWHHQFQATNRNKRSQKNGANSFCSQIKISIHLNQTR